MHCFAFAPCLVEELRAHMGQDVRGWFKRVRELGCQGWVCVLACACRLSVVGKEHDRLSLTSTTGLGSWLTRGVPLCL